MAQPCLKFEGRQSTASARLVAAKVLTVKEVASQPSASQQDRPISGTLLVGRRTKVNWVIGLVSTTQLASTRYQVTSRDHHQEGSGPGNLGSINVRHPGTERYVIKPIARTRISNTGRPDQ